MKKNLLMVLSTLKKYKKGELIGLVVTILYAIAVFLAPYASKYLIDDVLLANEFEKIYSGILIFFIVCISQPVLSFIKGYIFLKISEKITIDIRKDAFKSVIYAPIDFFYKSKKGDIVSRIMNDGRGVSDFLTDTFILVFKDIFLVIIVCVGMLLQCWQITMILFVFILLFILLNIFMAKKFQRLSDISLKSVDGFCSAINQSSDNINLIKSYNLEERVLDDYNKQLKKIYDVNMKMGWYSNILSSGSEVIIISSLCIIYGLGAFMVVQNSITLGAVISLGLYFQILNQPISELMNSNIRLNEIIPMYNRLKEYMSLVSERESYKDNNEEVCKSNSSETNIIFNNVSFCYDSNENSQKSTLKNINFNISKKGLYGIIGHSGSGKSTIAKLLMGLFKPTEGSIKVKVKGKEISSLYELRNSISYVAQDIELLNTTLYENLSLYNDSITIEDIEFICKKLGLHKKIMSLKDKYDSVVTEKINLSGGEKQRLAIARAYLRKSDIYIFDEITSALDEGIEQEVIDIINELAKTSVVIFITHKVKSIANANNVYLIKDGIIESSGRYDEIVPMIKTGGSFEEFN